MYIPTYIKQLYITRTIVLNSANLVTGCILKDNVRRYRILYTKMLEIY